MPIKIQNSLPARAILEDENIFVMTETRALHQDIRPLKIVILNLMPIKVVTETQLLRCLSNTPLQIEIDLLQTSTHVSKNTPEEHLLNFYSVFDDIKDNRYDGMIITGAPVESMDYEDVDYWQELCAIFEWTKTNVHSTFHICWGAQAALYYHFGIRKYPLPKKMFGIFEHKILNPSSRLVRGFDDVFCAPHSRNSEVRLKDFRKAPQVKVMATSDEAGVYLASAGRGRQIFVFGHPEYDADTLSNEYFRDLGRGIPIEPPVHYFRDNDPEKGPVVSWRSHANLLYTNWLNYYVYQTTPYNLNSIK
ncbi:MAG: homoserine O-succinyltransferase [Bacillota bacterium]|nr:homoserine O-succinyltransferase [Bacillota bacterium]